MNNIKNDIYENKIITHINQSNQSNKNTNDESITENIYNYKIIKHNNYVSDNNDKSDGIYNHRIITHNNQSIYDTLKSQNDFNILDDLYYIKMLIASDTLAGKIINNEILEFKYLAQLKSKINKINDNILNYIDKTKIKKTISIKYISIASISIWYIGSFH